MSGVTRSPIKRKEEYVLKGLSTNKKKLSYFAIAVSLHRVPDLRAKLFLVIENTKLYFYPVKKAV
jgi:hypothetical protein